MFVSITFEDRIEPYVKYCKTNEEMEEILNYWNDRYILKRIECTPSPYGGNYFYTAKEKRE